MSDKRPTLGGAKPGEQRTSHSGEQSRIAISSRTNSDNLDHRNDDDLTSAPLVISVYSISQISSI